MKPRETHLLSWIVVAALADWLITRGLARMAIFMPKSPPILAAYQGLITAGQVASLLCAISGLIALGWLAWRLRFHWGGLPSIAMLCLVGLSLLFVGLTPGGWLMLISRLLLLGTVVWFAARIWWQTDRLDHRLALMVPVLAVWTGLFYHSQQAFYAILRLPGPPAHATTLFNIGELLVVLSPVALWWVYGRRSIFRKSTAIYLLALLPGLLFLAAHRLNPSMTGILAVWSTGLTLYLPPALYAAGLWLGTVTLLAGSGRGGMALLLLAASGFAPQLSTQIFLALIGLSVLAGDWHAEQHSVPVEFIGVMDEQHISIG